VSLGLHGIDPTHSATPEAGAFNTRNLSDRKLRSSMRDVLSALSDPEYNSSSIFFSRPSVSIMSGLAKKAKSEWSTDSRGSLFTRRHHEVTTPGLWFSPRRYALIT
jgi:hypothetical protein